MARSEISGPFFILEREALNGQFQICDRENRRLCLLGSDAVHALGRGPRFPSHGYHGFRNGPIGKARGFANEFHAAADSEFREQGRDVKLHGALGEIQIAGNFLVGESAQDAAQNFFLATRDFHFALDRLAGIEKFAGLIGESFGVGLFGFNHDDVVLRRLAADHAMHGEKARRLL